MNLRAGVSPLELFIILFNIAVGGGMLTLPRSVADAAKEDMWMSVIFGGLLMLFSVWVLIRLSRYFPNQTCMEYHRILLGPILGQAANLLVLALILSIAFLALRSFGMALKMFVLDTTPPQLFLFVLPMLAVYAIQYGLAPLVRLQQFVMIPNYLFFLTTISLGLLAINTKNYLPILAEGFIPVATGVVPSWFAYSGPELVLGLIYPYVTNQKAVMKWSMTCIGALMFLYTFITVVVQGMLGPTETAHMLVPTIIAYRGVEIPDTFIERLDGYLMIFWIPIYFTSLINFLYFFSFGAGRLLKLESNRSISILLVPLMFYLSLVPPNMDIVSKLNKLYNIAGMIWGLGILPLLLIIAWQKEKSRRLC